MYGRGPQRDAPAGTREEGATAMDPREGTSQKTEQRYRLKIGGVRPKSFGAGNRQSFRLFYPLDEDKEPSETQTEGRPNPNPESTSELHTANPAQLADRPGNMIGNGVNPNTQFSRPPPFTAQLRLMLDKNNLLEEIDTLYTRFECSPIDAEKKKLKNLFYDRYDELIKELEELRVISDDPEHIYQLRKIRDTANAFKNAFGPLDTQRKQKHRIDPPEFDGDILKYHG